MNLTLTQVLAERRLVRLHGRLLTDLRPQGDLGLGLDPDGPVGFAQIRAIDRGGPLQLLRRPLIVTVFGDGVEPGADAPPGERVWATRLDDRAVHLALRLARIEKLLPSAGADLSE